MSSGFIAKRLLLTLPTLLGVIVIVFVLLRVVPGDPIAMMVPPEAGPEDIARLLAVYGLDKPMLEQFVIFAGQLARGDFGTSISLKQDVFGLVVGRLPATLELALVAIAVSLVAGVALALVATSLRGRWPEYLIDGFNSVALAIPEFLWALLLILAFAVLLPWLPISGRFDPTQRLDLATQFYLFESLIRGEFSLAANLIPYLVLPALALSLPLIAVIARVLKASLQEALVQDYVLFARIHGFSAPNVLVRQALPNALVPTISVTGVHFIFLVGGTVLVELIFSYPGIGNMLYGAAVNRDLPLIQGVTTAFAVLFVLFNLAVDLLYLAINPRVRHA
jgi:peptide/nickel transport system permease protein